MPLQYVEVDVYGALNDEYYGWTETDNQGRYTVSGLPAGSYNIEFDPYYSDYISKSYSSTVTVTASNTTSNISINLTEKYGTISGTVKNAAQVAIPYVGVELDKYNNDSHDWEGWNYNDTGWDGQYGFNRLPAGDYVLHFYSPINSLDGYYTASTTLTPYIDNAYTIHVQTGTNPTNYIANVPYSPVNPPQQVSVAFDAQGGTVNIASKTVAVGQTYGALPVPTRSGYTFAGWHTAATGGTQVSAATVVTNAANHTLYAYWTAALQSTPVPIADVSGAKAPVAPGGASDLPKSVTFPDGTSSDVNWTSSNNGIARIDSNGKLVAVAEGKVTLTATATNGSGKTQTITITVAKPVTKLRTPLTNISLTKGASLTLPVCADSVVNGKADATAMLGYTSSNPKVVKVDAKGKIKALALGKAKISITALNGKKLTATVNVVKKAAKLKSFKVSGMKQKLAKGKVAQLKLKITPASATNLKISFKSSNPKIIAIDKAGKLTAIKKGKAKITITVGKKKYTKTITVK
jgi:uncharacterized repeat protein (TIGR02543 family)